MNRPWHVALTLTACLAVVLAALSWVSVEMLRLDAAEATARQQAALESSVRLALWRMDTTAAGIVSRENARPYFAYNSFFGADRTLPRMANGGERERLVPSPLLVADDMPVRLHFQIDEAERISSPQVPEGKMRRLAVHGLTTDEHINAAAARLKELGTWLRPASLNDRLPPTESLSLPPAQLAQNNFRGAPEPNAAANGAPNGASNGMQSALNQSVQANQRSDYAARAQIVNNSAQMPPIDRLPDVEVGTMAPIWIGKQLVLARQVRVAGKRLVQGCWIDWPSLERSLLSDVEDLLPNARLGPAPDATSVEETRLLASLPVQLLPGTVSPLVRNQTSPVRISLLVAWVCVLLTAAAIAMLAIGIVTLSERRATFVSAVTHELRTPLTTFRMYAEMLAEGMVPDVDRQRDYLRTLQIEADRLSHLVENVLAYARLERNNARGGARETLSLKGLLERIETRLRDRARAAGMTLAVDLGAASDARVVVDVTAAEQILFNLADNAGKYAKRVGSGRIDVSATADAKHVRVRVSDDGPGIAPRDRRRLFQPFSKSAHDAAHSAPGVGLGLALSRRLARDLGGDLVFDRQHSPGASFILVLPVA